MGAADIVELDSVVVDVVEDGQTGFLTSTIGLGLSLDSGVGPWESTGGDGLRTTVGPLKGISEKLKNKKVIQENIDYISLNCNFHLTAFLDF